MSHCEVCGSATLKTFYKLCLGCWKDRQSEQPLCTTEKSIDKLLQENERLKRRVSGLEKINSLLHAAMDCYDSKPTQSIDDSLMRKLKMLCHPDKHGGSQLSTEVFKELTRL